MKRNLQNMGITGVLVAALVLPVMALAAEHDGQWHVDAEIYIWGAGADITPNSGQEVDASFNDLIDNLEMAFMGAMGARKDRWSWFGDAIYLGVDGDDTVSATVPDVPSPVDAKVDIELDAWVVMAGGGYELASTSDWNVDFIGGIRYLDLSTDVTVDLDGERAGAVSASGNGFDGVIGIKGRAGLGHKWTLGYYVDVGAGESDLTYQGLVGVNYKYSKVALGFGYRYLKWEFDNKGYLADFQIDGPYVGLTIRLK